MASSFAELFVLDDTKGAADEASLQQRSAAYKANARIDQRSGRPA
jgi:hypothetical protein